MPSFMLRVACWLGCRWEAAKRTFNGSEDEEVQLVLPQGLIQSVGWEKLQVGLIDRKLRLAQGFECPC